MSTEDPGRRRVLGTALLGAAAVAGAAAAAALPDLGAERRPLVDDREAHWAPADPANLTRSPGGARRPVDRIVVHMTQATFADTLGIFRNPDRRVSAHYLVRSVDGRIAQCVRERDIAWHAGDWAHNVRSIGIEHEGWVDRPRYFTARMYASSAALTARLCARHGIPVDREHIIGHREVPGTDHTDPGPLWDWDRYLQLVRA